MKTEGGEGERESKNSEIYRERESERELESRYVLHAWTLRSFQIIILPMAFPLSPPYIY